MEKLSTSLQVLQRNCFMNLKMKLNGFLLSLLLLGVIPINVDASAKGSCSANTKSQCGSSSHELNGEFFPEIPTIKYEGPNSKNPLAYKWYNADEEILGKKMKDWLRFSVAFWHTFRGTRADPFGAPTKAWPWENGTNSVAMVKTRSKIKFYIHFFYSNHIFFLIFVKYSYGFMHFTALIFFPF
ncbi:Xylose isomerase protein [Dioscorea alata]|uniref:Xylose isomerase protein n=1 Tax=Dioscorea alata TaxID=55571 RepID=A0ACB7U651_DIOAL|nr:Xylose isomerase protein [Dioscorea alata]